MKIEYKTIESRDVTNITLSGNLDINIIKEEIDKINQIVDHRGTNKTLVELQNVDLEFRVFEIYGAIKYLVSHLRDLKFLNRFAILINNKREFKRAKVMEIFLNDRGFNIKVFSILDEAMKWLDGSV